MKITKKQLRKIIREAIDLHEGRSIATVSDITRFTPQIEEWSAFLIDELAEVAPRMKEMDEKRRVNAVKSLAEKVRGALIDVTSGMSASDKSRIEKEELEKAHQEWDKNRQRRGGPIRYFGDGA